MRAVVLVCVGLIFAPALALAQAGSEGGSIGGNIGAPQTSRAVPRKKAHAHAERAAPSNMRAATPRDAGLARFDGAWTTTAVGCSIAGISNSTISQGRIISSQGVVVGHVAASGAAYSAGTINGIAIHGTGRLTATAGGGTYHQSDGCTGTWHANKL